MDRKRLEGQVSKRVGHYEATRASSTQGTFQSQARRERRTRSAPNGVGWGTQPNSLVSISCGDSETRFSLVCDSNAGSLLACFFPWPRGTCLSGSSPRVALAGNCWRPFVSCAILLCPPIFHWFCEPSQWVFCLRRGCEQISHVLGSVLVIAPWMGFSLERARTQGKLCRAVNLEC